MIHSFNADRTDEIKTQDTLMEAFYGEVNGLSAGWAAKNGGYIDITAYIKKR